MRQPGQEGGNSGSLVSQSGSPSQPAPAAVGDLGAQITHEDVDRARDRWAVDQARALGSRFARFRWLRLFWLLSGPGILVFLGENDAPSMLSYAATGSRFGIGFFIPFVVLTFVMAFVVQEMTVRLGAVTHRGHAELIFERFGRFWGFFSMADLVLGNFLTLVTEFIGVRAGLGFFGIRPAVAVLGSLLVIIAAITTGRYWTWERITLALASFNILFVPAALLANPPWRAIGHALLTLQPLPRGSHYDILVLIMADIGATVTPWMLFFQQSAVVDKGMQPRDIGAGRLDTLIGSLLAAIFGIAAIVAAAPLFRHGINVADFQAADFAQALRPLIGRTGATLFALGIFEAGMVAAITISTSSAYAFSETFHTAHSLNRPLREAWPFYLILSSSATLAALLVLIPHVPLIYVVLTVNVIAVLAMPPALVFLILLVNDRDIMGEFVNRAWQNAVQAVVVILLVLAGLVYGIATVFPKWLGA